MEAYIGHAALALVVLRYALDFLRWLAPKTKTKIDDRIVGAATGAITFIRTNAPTFWAIMEELKEAGVIKPDDRAAKYLDAIETAYQQATGKGFTVDERVLANTEAVALSAADKAVRPQGNITVGKNETTIGVRLGKAIAHLKLARGEKPSFGVSMDF